MFKTTSYITVLAFIYCSIVVSLCHGNLLVWDANSEYDLAGYKVYHTTVTKVYLTVTDVGNVTEIPLEDINLSEGYSYIAITAYDTSNNESASSSVLITGYIDDHIDTTDNCPEIYNPGQEDRDCDGIGDICDGLIIDCTEGVDCDNDCDGIYNQNDNCPNAPNQSQEDTYPPGGNGIGDACDCEADFDCNGAVDADDIIAFLTDFGRERDFNPCTNQEPCNGDFYCDGNVAAEDIRMLVDDFGRDPNYNPCPDCAGGAWCSY